MQAGCGHAFDWDKAARYETDLSCRQELDKVQALQEEVTPKIHKGIECKLCGVASIVGLRLRCIQCVDDFSICSECSFVAPEQHGHSAFDFVPGGVLDAEVQDPRVTPWGCAMAASRTPSGEQKQLVLTALFEAASADSKSERDRLCETLRAAAKGAGLHWWDASDHYALMEQLCRRYLLPRPCVLAIDPRTRRVERMWQAKGLAALACACSEDALTDLVEEHSGESGGGPQVELVGLFAEPEHDPWHHNAQMELKLRPRLQRMALGGFPFHLTWWESLPEDQVGKELCRRHGVSRPCVAAVDTRTRVPLHVWKDQDLVTLCSARCEDLLTEFVLERSQ